MASTQISNTGSPGCIFPVPVQSPSLRGLPPVCTDPARLYKPMKPSCNFEKTLVSLRIWGSELADDTVGWMRESITGKKRTRGPPYPTKQIVYFHTRRESIEHVCSRTRYTSAAKGAKEVLPASVSGVHGDEDAHIRVEPHAAPKNLDLFRQK